MDIFNSSAPKQWTHSVTFPDQGTAGGLEYNVIRNDNVILAIKIGGMSCGASCWPSDRYYNFDVKTGRHLRLSDFLTRNGVEQANKAFIKELEVAFKKWQAKVEKDETKRPVKWQQIELPDFFKGRLGLADIDWQPDFLVKKDDLSVFGSLDYKGYEQYEYSLDLAKNNSILSSYGKYIFLGASEAEPEKIDPYKKLLHGYIGKSSIKMMLYRSSCFLQSDGEQCSILGYYFYDKYRQVIAIEGILKGMNKIELTEYTNNKKAVMNLSVNGETLKGKWVLDKKVVDVEITSF